jgi:putative SOS response-associated peptidase YedK
MCGRLNVSSGPLTLLFMDMVSQPYPGSDSHNVAPTEDVTVLRATQDGELRAAPLRWWLTPYWSKQPSTQYSMFNAKSETLATSRAFAEPFARRRCLVPIAGFYEWTRVADRKLPYYIRPHADDGLLLAGIWDRWRGAEAVIESFAIVTTDAHASLAFVHNRQPVLLSRKDAWRWVDRSADTTMLARELLAPRVPVALSVVPVSTYVNNARNEGARCIEPVGAAVELAAQG